MKLQPRRAIAVMTVATCACSTRQALPTPIVVGVLVESDPGVPLPHAEIFYSGKNVGTTADDGTANLTLAGEEGQSFELSIRCPEGYKSPASPLAVKLRRLAEPGKVARYQAICTPLTRKVVVAVAADKGANLPVLYLGSEVARTDASGAATVLLRIAPGEQFSLTLDTSGKGAESLRPRNPIATFTVKNEDEVFVFNPHFAIERTARPVSHPRGPVEVGH